LFSHVVIYSGEGAPMRIGPDLFGKNLKKIQMKVKLQPPLPSALQSILLAVDDDVFYFLQ
jgi:hypothetical protein